MPSDRSKLSIVSVADDRAQPVVASNDPFFYFCSTQAPSNWTIGHYSVGRPIARDGIQCRKCSLPGYICMDSESTCPCSVHDRCFAIQNASCLKTSTSSSIQRRTATAHPFSPGCQTCPFARRPPRCSSACLASAPRVRPPLSSPPHMTVAAAARAARTSSASSVRAACGSSSASRPSSLGCSSAWHHSRGFRAYRERGQGERRRRGQSGDGKVPYYSRSGCVRIGGQLELLWGDGGQPGKRLHSTLYH